jgi:hypothetical protein
MYYTSQYLQDACIVPQHIQQSHLLDTNHIIQSQLVEWTPNRTDMMDLQYLKELKLQFSCRKQHDIHINGARFTNN